MRKQSISQSRNRDNQRRSRARRQDYIKDLEQRIRSHEAACIQATAEVQAAAKKVLDDNARLRSLLQGTFGVTEEQIDKYLNDGIAPLVSQVKATPSLKVAQSRKGRYTGQRSSLEITDSHKASDTASSCQEVPVPFPSRSDGGVSQGPLGSQYEASQVSADKSRVTFATPDSDVALSVLQVDETLTPADDETSCEAAAHIIAGMRGLADSNEVLPELGCGGRNTCSVKNMTIFQMMDQ